jgi:hypothetical protein
MKFQVTVLTRQKRLLWETSVEAESQDAGHREAHRVAAEQFPQMQPDDYQVVLSRPVESP